MKYHMARLQRNIKVSPKAYCFGFSLNSVHFSIGTKTNYPINPFVPKKNENKYA